MTPEWFPAWMLLQEPGLARVLPERGLDDAPSRAYDTVRRLLRHPNGENEDHVTLRRALQVAHAGLLERYLASRRA